MYMSSLQDVSSLFHGLQLPLPVSLTEKREYTSFAPQRDSLYPVH